MESEHLVTRLKHWASHPSYAGKDFEERSRALAQYLLTQDTAPIAPGDRVVLSYLPSLEFMIAFLACIRAGIIAVPVYPPNPRNLSGDLKRFVRIATLSGAVAVLTHSKYNRLKRIGGIAHSAKSLLRSKGKAKWPNLPWVLTDRDASHIKSTVQRSGKGESLVLDSVSDPNALAFLQYTSGTTAAPRGVMVTHGNFTHNLITGSTNLKVVESSVSVTWLPCYHDLGLIGAALAPAYVGGSTVFTSPFDFIMNPAGWIDTASRFRATHIQAPNFSYILAARKWLARKKSVLGDDGRPKVDLSCVVHALNAAEPVTANALDAFRDLFAPAGLSPSTLSPGYGIADHTVATINGGRLRVRVERNALERGADGMDDEAPQRDAAARGGTSAPTPKPLGVARIRQWHRNSPLFVTPGYHRTKEAPIAERDASGASGEAEEDDGVEDMQWHWWGEKREGELEQPPSHCPLNCQEIIGCGPVTRDDGVTVAIVDPVTRHAWFRSDRPPAEGPYVKPDAVPIGEIWLRSPSVAAGYWNMPHLTENTFRATLRGEMQPEEDEAASATASSSCGVGSSDASLMYWLRTEDMGFVWGGELFFAGRLAEWMTIGDRHYYPYDIEQTADSVLAPQRPPDPSLPATVREGLLQGVLRAGCSAAIAVPLGVVHRVLQVMQRKLPKGDNSYDFAPVPDAAAAVATPDCHDHGDSDGAEGPNVLVLISEYRTELLTQPTKEGRAEQRRRDAIRIARAILVGHGILPAAIIFLHKRKIRKTTSGKLAHYLNEEALHMLANGDPRGPWQPRNKSIHLVFPVSPKTLQVEEEEPRARKASDPAQLRSDGNDMFRYVEGGALARSMQWELGKLLNVSAGRIPLSSAIPRLGLDLREYEQFKETLSTMYGFVRVTDSVLLNSGCSLHWLARNAQQLRDKRGLLSLPDGDREQLNILTTSVPQRGLDHNVQYHSGYDTNPSSRDGKDTDSGTDCASEASENDNEEDNDPVHEKSVVGCPSPRMAGHAVGSGSPVGAAPGRRRSSGYLVKRGGGSGLFSSKAWKKRFVVIEDGHMRYWADESEFARGRQSLKNNVVDVSKYRVEAVAESNDPFLIVLRPTHNPSLRSWELRTENEEERAMWVRIFREQGAEIDTTLRVLPSGDDDDA